MGNTKRVTARAIFAIILVIGGGVIGASLIPPEVLEVEKIVYVDRIVEIEKIIYVEKIVEVEKTIYVDILAEFENIYILKQWLKQDIISERAYTDKYYCRHFSQDLVRAARADGYEMFIYMYFSQDAQEGHAITYVYINGEPYFIEPQTDEIVGIGWQK